MAIFLEAAEPVYGAIDFTVDVTPESAGGEQAIVAGRTSFAGIAKPPDAETLEADIGVTLIGRDGIAVIVNAKNPVLDVSLSGLREIFTGRAKNWSAFGGPNLPIEPWVVGEESATRKAFAAVVLGGEPYAGCQEVRPDEAIVRAVAETPGAIGQISFSFLEKASGVRAISVGGEEPVVTNFDYPISRPLYLLWRGASPVVEAFVEWTLSEEGQRVVRRHFVGARVLGSVGRSADEEVAGTLIVESLTFEVYDGGINYYPHRPYDVLDRQGQLIRHVRNHRGDNDESPMRVNLAPGTYLIRTDGKGEEPVEFLVTVEADKLTELDVAELVSKMR